MEEKVQADPNALEISWERFLKASMISRFFSPFIQTGER